MLGGRGPLRALLWRFWGIVAHGQLLPLGPERLHEVGPAMPAGGIQDQDVGQGRGEPLDVPAAFTTRRLKEFHPIGPVMPVVYASESNRLVSISGPYHN